MGSDRSLHEQLASLARELRSHTDPRATLQHVVDATRELIGPCEAASVSVATARGGITTSACSSLVALRADRLQEELGEGPCLLASWRDRVVSSPDLAHDPRWPRWGPVAATELGLGSAVCVQLFTHEGRLGALNVFAARPHAFEPRDLVEIESLGAHAAVALRAAERIDHLTTAMHSRTDIGHAVGLTMARYGLTADQALGLLRRLSNERHVTVRSLADEIVSQHEDRLREGEGPP